MLLGLQLLTEARPDRLVQLVLRAKLGRLVLQDLQETPDRLAQPALRAIKVFKARQVTPARLVLLAQLVQDLFLLGSGISTPHSLRAM
jgi:hypothetical protein